MKKLAIVISLFAASLLPAQPAMSDHYPDFDKNFLIDDRLFVDHDSMSVAEIQQFLDNNGSLLANWIDNVDMRRPSTDCVVHKATNMTAAEIIHEASTAWNAQIVENCSGTDISYWGDPDYSNYTMPTVSPKVLLVLLQKEQSLISANGTYSTNPNDYKDPVCCGSNEYKLARATGYGVPDSGSINEKYLGFYNQINWAAWQLRYNYERSAGNTGWDEVGYKIYTGPMIEGTWKQCDTCSPVEFDGYYPIDGSSLYMDNRSTASLYYYTPHTHPPYNGNSNFVIFYTDWFGSIYGYPYAYRYHSQSRNPAMLQGLSNDAFIRYKNYGSETWYDQSGLTAAPSGTLPVFISTDRDVARTSAFSAKWYSQSIPTREFNRVYESDGKTLTANQDMVEPGQIAEFKFPFTAPDLQKIGPQREYFTLIRAGTGGGRMRGGVTWITPFVVEAKYNAQYVTQSFPGRLEKQDSQRASITLKNTGNIDWFGVDNAPVGYKPIRLATFNPLNNISELSRNWFTGNRPVNNFSAVYESDGITLSSNQNVVKPDQIALFDFNFSATKRAQNGNLREYFKLVRERSKRPLFGPTFWLPTEYDDGDYSATWRSQSGNPVVSPGSTVQLKVTYENSGDTTWNDTTGNNDSSWAPIRLIPIDPLNRVSEFASGSWLAPNRPAADFHRVLESDGATLAANQHEVKPGQLVEFQVEFFIPANTEPGVYKEKFIPVRDGAASWRMDSATTMWFNITVQ